jgi:hypothetical protein
MRLAAGGLTTSRRAIRRACLETASAKPIPGPCCVSPRAPSKTRAGLSSARLRRAPRRGIARAVNLTPSAKRRRVVGIYAAGQVARDRQAFASPMRYWLVLSNAPGSWRSESGFPGQGRAMAGVGSTAIGLVCSIRSEIPTLLGQCQGAKLR